jgi:hypothetical protein
MDLSITRTNNDGITIKTDSLGLVMVFQNTTAKEHKEIMEDLETVFPDGDVFDIFYDYKNVSIFIFDAKPEMTLSKEDKECIFDAVAEGGKRKYAIILHGKIEKGNTLNQLIVREIKHGIYIGKQFTTLLTMSQGNLTE